MTEEVINSLPEILKKYICTLKKASTDTTNQKPMSESKIKVINFDKIPNEFARGRRGRSSWFLNEFRDKSKKGYRFIIKI